MSEAQKDKPNYVFKPERVLVLVKQTLKARAAASDDEAMKKLLEPGDHKDRLDKTDDEHNLTLKHVVGILTDRDITACCMTRTPGETVDVGNNEMLITIGGDGTFLDANHSVKTSIPMLGVNSAPITSFGHFCLTDRTGFEKVFDDILLGKRKPYSLTRLKLTLDDQVIEVPVLNEVLITHSCPAGTSRYKVEVAGGSASHKSSGLIVSTASGSTGFMRAAHGYVLDITDTQYAFWVDKPFIQPGYSYPLRGGVVQKDASVVVTSEMMEGMLYIDGAHISRPFPRGAKLTISVHENPLSAYIDASCHNRFKPAA
ncbi:MAG: NAD(+)/NADH kinase [Candidatus Obscuribacterales bacterium]|nr:NAD(+)/NADH kinase [Candidatus Obscuribacterales bacterium]